MIVSLNFRKTIGVKLIVFLHNNPRVYMIVSLNFRKTIGVKLIVCRLLLKGDYIVSILYYMVGIRCCCMYFVIHQSLTTDHKFNKQTRQH